MYTSPIYNRSLGDALSKRIRIIYDAIRTLIWLSSCAFGVHKGKKQPEGMKENILGLVNLGVE